MYDPLCSLHTANSVIMINHNYMVKVVSRENSDNANSCINDHRIRRSAGLATPGYVSNFKPAIGWYYC